MKVCKVEGCNTKHYSKGYCQKHYSYWKNHGVPVFIRPIILCSVGGCNRIQVSKGFCDKHYTRYKRHKDPLFTNHHNKSHTPVHNTWTGMKSRCYNKNQPGYKD